MQTYEILVRGRAVYSNSEDTTLVRTSIGIDKIHVMFDNAEWLDFALTVTFAQGETKVTSSLTPTVLDGGEWVAEAECLIPWEVIQMTGPIRVTFQGYDANDNHIITAAGSPLSVEEAGDVDDGEPPETAPTQSQWEQAYAAAMAAASNAQSAADDVREVLDDIVTYERPPATTETLGEVMADGTSITVDTDGTIHSTAPVAELPIASESVLGGVKVGGNLSIDSNGVLSAQDSYVLPTASTSQLGGVKIDGDTVNIDANGVISTAPSAQSDWDETDSTDPAYIANKPFGYVAGMETVIAQATFGGSAVTYEGTIPSSTGTSAGRYAYVNTATALETITNNTEYTLTVDGTEYTVTSYQASAQLWNSDDTQYRNITGYYITTPYCALVKESSSDTVFVLLKTSGEWTTVPSRTVKLEREGQVIVQIDPDFIPIDNVYIIVDSNGKLTLDIEAVKNAIDAL